MAIQADIRGKRIVLTGATGGLGRQLCKRLAAAGAVLYLPVRNLQKGAALKAELAAAYPAAQVFLLPFDAADFASVQALCTTLEQLPFEVFFWCAGAYKIPRTRCTTGLDNLFQINFATPYYMICRLLPLLEQRPGSRVVAVGSIAHRYGKVHARDLDFSSVKGCAGPYGNAKRWLTAALYERFITSSVPLCVVHPGIAVTDMTAHFPPRLYKLLKPIMQVIFMSPRRAAESLLAGLGTDCGAYEWVGPWLLDIWGSPVKRRLRGFSKAERRTVADLSRGLYAAICADGRYTKPAFFAAHHTVFYFETLPSTNAAAKQWGLCGAPAGTVLWAGSQTAGRGRGTHTFDSRPGGLYCSILLPITPDFTPFAITVPAAVAVRRALIKFAGCTPQIKWVNDIYLNNRKVCGILAEGVFDSEKPFAVLGIGVNLLAPAGGFPAELSKKAGAVLPQGTPDDIAVFLKLLLAEWDTARHTPWQQILAEYRAADYLAGRRITYTQNGVVHHATACGIDDCGRLTAAENGRRTTLACGEVSIDL